MNQTANTGGSPCKLTPAPPGDLQCDYHCPAGSVSFSVDIDSGGGTVGFSAFSVDGHNQSLSSPLTASLRSGQHKLTFVLAFSDPSATAVIQEACSPPQGLVLVDASSPFDTLRICVP